MRAIVLFLVVGTCADAQGVGEVIGWKFPLVPGIETRADRITRWPESHGTMPTARQIETWRAEYLAARAEVDKQRRIDETNVVMARWVEELTVTLHGRLVLLAADIPTEVRNVINARRAERGQAPIAW